MLYDPDFKKTSKTIVKQLVNVRTILEVTEYHADVYYNSKTGERIHAEFPAGVVDDVNYGGSIKAFLFLLNNDCCTSIDKSRKFLSDLTDHLLFLHDHRVPTTNNESERLLGQYKRKQQQAVTFRGFESIEYLCQCMSMLIQIRQNEGTNLFCSVSQIFG